MRIAALHLAKVNIHARVIRQRDEKLARQTCIELADATLLQFPIELQVSASAEIHCAQHQNFVHRRDEKTVARDSAFVADGLI